MPIHSISIDGRPIGPDRPPYIIAELSANHNGKIDRADGGPDAAFSLEPSELCDLVQGARTGWAYPPKKYLPKVIGNRASRPLRRGTSLAFDMIAPSKGESR